MNGSDVERERVGRGVVCVLEGGVQGGVNSSQVIHRCLKDFSYNLFAAARFV